MRTPNKRWWRATNCFRMRVIADKKAALGLRYVARRWRPQLFSTFLLWLQSVQIHPHLFSAAKVAIFRYTQT